MEVLYLFEFFTRIKSVSYKTNKARHFRIELCFLSDLDGSKIKPYFESLDGFESVGIASLIR